MAESKVKKDSGFSSVVQNISTPYNALADGFIFLRGTPNTGDNAFLYITKNGNSFMQTFSIAGCKITAIGPVQKGDTLRIDYQVNIRDYSLDIYYL